MYNVFITTRKGYPSKWNTSPLTHDDAQALLAKLLSEGYKAYIESPFGVDGKPKGHVEILPKHLDEACTLHGIMTGSAFYTRIEAEINSPSFNHAMPEPRRHTVIVRGDMRDEDDMSTAELNGIRQPSDHVEVHTNPTYQAWEIAQTAYRLALVNYCPKGEVGS